jgi:hypothetical protein
MNSVDRLIVAGSGFAGSFGRLSGAAHSLSSLPSYFMISKNSSSEEDDMV